MRHPTHLFERLFYCLGYQIGRHPLRIIVATLSLSLIASLGLVNFEEVNNVRSEYSPLNAPSRMEYAVAKAFLGQNGGVMDPAYVMVTSRDGGDLLRDEHRMLLYNLTRAIQSEVHVEKNGRHYFFNDLCEPYCAINTAFTAFLRLYDRDQPVTYPSLEFFGSRAFIGNNVYGVKLKEGGEELESFTTAILPLYLVASQQDTDVLIRWQRAAIKLFRSEEYSGLLKVGMTGDHLVSNEVRRMGVETLPLIFGSIVAMILFVVCTSFRVFPIQSKPWEALIGCLIPLLAMSSAMGIMSTLGMRFQSIVVAAIFLVLSVGVDDIFILLRAWHRTATPSMSVPERMAIALEDAGPSITISSLTNVMSFAIGALSDTPAIRTFCCFSAVAITICYFYQLILLAAVVALSGHREANEYGSILCCFPSRSNDSRCWVVECGERLHEVVVRWWSVTVTRWQTRFLLTVIMIAYFYVSWTGIRQMHSKISIDKMALPNSYLHDFQQSFEKALEEMQPISVFVTQPGDLRQTEQMNRLKRLVFDFEHAVNSYGPASTFFWVPQYEEYLRFYSPETDEEPPSSFDDSPSTTPPPPPPPFTYTELPAFFRSATYGYLSSFVRLNASACALNQPECLVSFFFITNFHGVIKYHELIPALRDWRRIAGEYSDLGVYPYSDHSPFVDQTLSIDATVYGSVAAALLCTAAICLLFIPHLMSVLAAVSSVFSISWGAFGLLSLWGVDLDPLSMAALIMGIGFSVDFTSHISFHYYKAPTHLNAQRRMHSALSVIGWPMMQVGLSTIVALLPLLFKQSYLALVFLKTIVVVVLLGMFHGLVILPSVLTLFSHHRQRREEGSGGHNRKESNDCSSTSTTSSSSRGGNNSSSGRSSQRSAITASTVAHSHSNAKCKENRESFYINQRMRSRVEELPVGERSPPPVIASNKDRGVTGWLSRNRSFFSAIGGGGGGGGAKEIKKVQQLKVEQLANAQFTSPTAYIHRIPLGRSSSTGI